jgi:hypothetical protein
MSAAGLKLAVLLGLVGAVLLGALGLYASGKSAGRAALLAEQAQAAETLREVRALAGRSVEQSNQVAVAATERRYDRLSQEVSRAIEADRREQRAEQERRSLSGPAGAAAPVGKPRPAGGVVPLAAAALDGAGAAGPCLGPAAVRLWNDAAAAFRTSGAAGEPGAAVPGAGADHGRLGRDAADELGAGDAPVLALRARQGRPGAVDQHATVIVAAPAAGPVFNEERQP